LPTSIPHTLVKHCAAFLPSTNPVSSSTPVKCENVVELVQAQPLAPANVAQDQYYTFANKQAVQPVESK